MGQTQGISGSRRPRARWRAAVCAAAALGTAGPALAQLRLPQISTPALPRLPLPSAAEVVNRVLPIQDLRAATVRDLLRRHPELVEADPAGHPMRRGELVWLSPTPAAVEAAQQQGFVVLREQSLDELAIRQWVLRPPAGLGTAEGAERLRRLDPEAAVDFNHLYLGAGERAAAEPPLPPPAGASAPGGERSLRLGLIDGGVDRLHPAFAAARIQPWGCGGQTHGSAHGTAVASLLIGRDGAFSGVRPGAALYAADVYCAQPAGGAAEDVARALAWMVRERVPVVNMSLVGPPNALLEKAVQALARQGHLIVAAVGNDGPAAPPLYPAAYPGVIGVSGVTPARRALPEAAQGPHVMFSAPGSELAVARAGGGYGAVRGTSYAAPIVAGLLAQMAAQVPPLAAAAALSRLGDTAVDLGEAGRDPVYGLGLVGESARTPLERAAERRR